MKVKKQLLKVVAIMMAVLLILPTASVNAQAKTKKKAKTPVLSRKSITMKKATGNYVLTIKNASKKAKIKWSVKGDSDAVDVIRVSKRKIRLEPLDNGNGKIVCKVNKKKLTCKFRIDVDEFREDYDDSEEDEDYNDDSQKSSDTEPTVTPSEPSEPDTPSEPSEPDTPAEPDTTPTEPTVTPTEPDTADTPSYSTRFQLLRNYIDKNGKYNDDDEKTVTLEKNGIQTDEIPYGNASIDISNTTDGDISLTVFISWLDSDYNHLTQYSSFDISASGKLNIIFESMTLDNDIVYTAFKNNYDPSTYIKDTTDIDFTIINNTDDIISDSTLNGMANGMFSATLSLSDTYLRSLVGFGIKDLGFTHYND